MLVYLVKNQETRWEGRYNTRGTSTSRVRNYEIIERWHVNLPNALEATRSGLSILQDGVRVSQERDRRLRVFNSHVPLSSSVNSVTEDSQKSFFTGSDGEVRIAKRVWTGTPHLVINQDKVYPPDPGHGVNMRTSRTLQTCAARTHNHEALLGKEVRVQGRE